MKFKALANRPTYDPNERASLTWEDNRCVTDTFEPGSTFKIVTTAATLNEGLVTLDTPIFCENGLWFWAGVPLRDHSSYGTLTVEQVLQKSSNVGFAKLGLKLGETLLYRYIREFGFGQTVLNQIMPGEQIGTLRPLTKWSKLSITRVPIGYEVAATPLQMITAMSAIANDGVLMRPMLIHEVLDEEGSVVARYSPRVVKQIIRPEIAKQVIKALSSVVSQEGTAGKAAVEGFTVAGKTGTSRKWDNEAKEYSHKRYLASFIGFLPAQDPEFALLTIIDEPSSGGIYGGQVAAPVFSAMASRIARHLDLSPETSFWEVASR
ncbi:MAG: penicillin-binding protein 2 [Verrucomicrobiia bacterium]